MTGTLNEKNRLLDVLELKDVDRVPCASPLQTGTVDLMRASGAFWPEANNDARLMARLARAAHTVAGIESVRVPFDVSVDASAFGAVAGKETMDRQPSILEPTICSPKDLDKAKVPDPTRDGRAPIVLEAIKGLARISRTPVICGIVSPFMLAVQLRGGQEGIMDVIARPGFLKEVLEIATEWNIVYAQAALRAGADIITMIDATASGDILGPSQYAEFAMPYQKRVVGEIRKAGGYSILHICGQTVENMSFMVRSGANGISVDQQMDIGWVKERVNGKAAVIGNVSPTSTLLFDKPMDVMIGSADALTRGRTSWLPAVALPQELRLTT